MSTPSIVDVLNLQFSINGRLAFALGEGDLPVAQITTEQATAVVSLYAGHILSFTPAGQPDLLWVSDEAVFQTGTAIRGGIPIIWPWFGSHPDDETKSSHGFARRQMWSVVESMMDDDGRIHLTLGLSNSEASKSIWSHDFELRLHIVVGQVLEVALKVTNSGDVPFSYTAALHTYFNITNISNITIRGLESGLYLDNLDNKAPKEQSGFIRFDQEVDRIFIDTTAVCFIDDPDLNRTIWIRKEGSRSTVVWNPWIDKAQRMSDFGNEEYKEMVCVETAVAGNESVELEGGETAVLKAIIGTTLHPETEQDLPH